MKEAQWTNDGYASSYLELVWTRFSSISPWYMLLLCAPVFMWLLVMATIHRSMLAFFASLGALAPLATAHKAGLGKLRLRDDLKQLPRMDPDAFPCDVEITKGKNLIGEDQGIVTLDNGILVFRGNRTEFRFGRHDVGEIDPMKKPSGYDENEIKVAFHNDYFVKIRQRSFGMVESTSGRFKRVMAAWEANNKSDENPVLPPMTPNKDAYFEINSAYSWSVMAFIFAVILGVISTYMTRTADSLAVRIGVYAFDAVAVAMAALFIWFGFYGLRLARRRKEFYAQFLLDARALAR